MNEAVKKYGPWVALAIGIIVVLVLLQKFRSGYTVQPNGAPPIITMMDLSEYSFLTQAQKDKYSTLLKAASTQLTGAANSNSLNEYQAVLSNLMNQAVQTKNETVVTTGQNECLTGYYSETGMAPCTQCPLNTFCTTRGMKTPTPCPATKPFSRLGSTSVMFCQATPIK